MFSISFLNCKKRKEKGHNGYWVIFESPGKLLILKSCTQLFLYLFYSFIFTRDWVEFFLIYDIDLESERPPSQNG